MPFVAGFKDAEPTIQKQGHLAFTIQAEASSFNLDLPYNDFGGEVIPLLANYFLPSLEEWPNTLPWTDGGW